MDSALSPTTCPTTTLERSCSAKRKRCGKSPVESPIPFNGRLFQIPLCHPSSAESPTPAVPGTFSTSAIRELDSDSSTSDMAVQTDAILTDALPMRLQSPVSSSELSSPAHAFGLTISTTTSATAENAATATAVATTTWSFLAHPALRLLPKWPALYSSASTQAPPNSAVSRSPMSSIPVDINAGSQMTGSGEKSALQLLALLDIPPIAASIASNLYGHDLQNLRRLNSSFKELLSTETSRDGQRPYFHTLLLKSLLCPRTNTALEPVGVPCKSSGGDVGPCVFCGLVICTTCVSPEIWTTRRYRYLCPPCTTPPPSTLHDDYCKCQDHLWICRPCYVSRWLEDLIYSAGGWIGSKPIITATCRLCGTQHSHKTDSRLPSIVPKGRREEFSKWMSAVGSAVPKGSKPKKGKVNASTMACTLAEECRKPRKRPVGCGWCGKRVNPEKEDWELRPEKIRKGEERGRLWNMELERRRRERDGYESETGSSGAASSG